MSGILVGVDGSGHSRRALAWAMREAVQHDVPLTVLSVHPGQVRPATGIYWGVHSYPGDGHNADVARAAVQEFADKVVREIGEKAPEVRIDVVTGNPAEELVRASRDADMVVVGCRGSGGFGRLLMGSVSTQVMHHAACPVVIVPPAA